MNIPRISGPPIFKVCLSPPENTAINLEKQSEISQAGLKCVMRLELGPNCKIIQLSSVVILMHCVCVCVCVVCCGFFLVCFVFPFLKTGRFRAHFFTLWWIFLFVKNL